MSQLSAYQRRKMVREGVILPRKVGRPKGVKDGQGASTGKKSACPLCDKPMVTGGDQCRACYLEIGRTKQAKRMLCRLITASSIGQKVLADITAQVSQFSPLGLTDAKTA